MSVGVSCIPGVGVCQPHTTRTFPGRPIWQFIGRAHKGAHLPYVVRDGYYTTWIRYFLILFTILILKDYVTVLSHLSCFSQTLRLVPTLLHAAYPYLLYSVVALSRAPTGSCYNYQLFLPNTESRSLTLLQIMRPAVL